MRITPLEPAMNSMFIEFLMRDIVGNFFALLNLKYSKEKTKFWLALEGDEVIGYLLEHDDRIISLRSDARSAAELLKMTRLERPELNVESANIQIAKRFFEPIDSIGVNRSKINTIFAMTVDKEHFKPIIKHNPKKLGSIEFDALGKLYEKFYEEMALGPITREQIGGILSRSTEHGATCGIHNGKELVSFASGSSILKDIAHMAPVYTSPKFRRRGYATSACSALVRELLGDNERLILFVSEDNVPALKVYKKIGFAGTGHTFLTFWGRREGST